MSDDSMSRAHAIKGQSMVDRRGLDGGGYQPLNRQRGSSMIAERPEPGWAEVVIEPAGRRPISASARRTLSG